MYPEMIQFRENGKFFTEPIEATTVQEAFHICMNYLLESGFTNSQEKSFKRILLDSNECIMSTMWDRAILEEKNGTHTIFCIYDTGGWRFFGRV